MLNSFIRQLFYPLHGHALILIIIFSLMMWVVIFSGIFGIAFGPFLLVWFLNYCFQLAEHSSHGEVKSPAIKSDSFLLFYEMRPFKLILIIIVLYNISFFVGMLAAFIIILLLLPAIISILIIEDDLFAALNPVNIFYYMLKTGFTYFGFILILLTGFALVAYFYSSEIWLLPSLFLMQAALILTFHLIGSLLYTRYEQINYKVVNDRERIKQEEKRHNKIEFSKRMQYWHRLNNVYKHKRAFPDVVEYLDSNDNDVNLYDMLLKEFVLWDKANLLYMLINRYVSRFVGK